MYRKLNEYYTSVASLQGCESPIIYSPPFFCIFENCRTQQDKPLAEFINVEKYIFKMLSVSKEKYTQIINENRKFFGRRNGNPVRMTVI